MIIIATKITKELDRYYHFEYLGFSTDTIIGDGSALKIVFFNDIGEIGTTLEKNEGNATISRPQANEYGVQMTPLSFELGLIKENELPFDEEEARVVERWLTSPMYSSELKIESCKFNYVTTNEDGAVVSTREEYEDTYYNGLFTQTRWERGNGGLFLCTATFLCRDPYPYRTYSYTFEPNLDFEIHCHSDELERFVYPIIRVRGRNLGASSFTLYLKTDNNQSIKITTTSKLIVTIDCQQQRIYTSDYVNGEYVEVTPLKFQDVGLHKTATIYWPRLYPGINTLRVDGDVDIIITYGAPYKKVGGWLL